ncbi:MAG: hypothetical protein SchgKO_12610 [Schleiferiaceae bacterium]
MIRKLKALLPFLFVIVSLMMFLSCSPQESSELVVKDNKVYFPNTGLKDEEAKEYYQEAMLAEQNEEFDRAWKLMNKAYQLEPTNVEVLNALGILSSKVKSQPDYNFFFRAIQIDSTFAYSYSNCAFVYNTEKEFALAEKMLYQGLPYVTNDGDRAVFYHMLSVCNLEQGRCEEAKEYIRQACHLMPNMEVANRFRNYEAFVHEQCDLLENPMRFQELVTEE